MPLSAVIHCRSSVRSPGVPPPHYISLRPAVADHFVATAVVSGGPVSPMLGLPVPPSPPPSSLPKFFCLRPGFVPGPCGRPSFPFSFSLAVNTVRAEVYTVVLFSRISRVKPSRKFPLQFMSIYSYDNISNIAKLTPRVFPHLTNTA